MKTTTALIAALILCIGMQAHAQEPETPILPQKSEAQADLERLDEGIARVAVALNYTAGVLAREHEAIVSLPDDRLLAVLNANVQRSIAIIQSRQQLAVSINGFLNQLNIDRLTNRAPVDLPERLILPTADAPQFSMTPLPEPEAPAPPAE